MKATGIVRNVDSLGRIVLPAELRSAFDIGFHEPVEIFTDKDMIVLRKYKPESSCIFCDSVNNVQEYEGKRICNKCIEKLKNKF